MARRLLITHGFTLIELIIVIVVLSILALGTTQFITQSADSYQDTARREQLSSAARIAIEKVVREVRNAHPASVRVLDGGSCLQLLPILTSGSYQDQSVNYGSDIAAVLPVETSGTSFDAFGVSIPAGTTYVMAGTGDPYPLATPGSMIGYSDVDGTVTLPAGVLRILIPNHRFANHSPARRFYLIGDTMGFCVQGGNLYRHSGFALGAAAPWDIATTGVLLAENVSGGPFFTYTGATTSRNALLGISWSVGTGAELITLSHEVQIRNVP